MAGTKFCGDCGTALDSGVPLNCDKCGAMNPPSQKFCGTCGNSLVANADTDPDIRHLQEVLKERYVILNPLGEGGFGRVFLAEHTGLKQKHVIEVLSADSSRSTDIRNRFFQEAQAIARLKHPNIVPIMDVSESGGRPYYIMSYLEGGSLEDLLLKEKKLSVETALNLVSKLLSALSEVHKKGIIHRDIKPSNVLLDETGEPILIDFGIARVEESTGSKTKTGISIGTPQYMSPEQLDAKPINLTTDIYSMGILLFELLTGKSPFEGSISSLITQHNSGVMPSLSNLLSETHLVEEIQIVLQKACAKEPGGRFSTAWDMREVVEAIVRKLKEISIETKELEPIHNSQQKKVVQKEQKPIQTPIPLQKKTRKVPTTLKVISVKIKEALFKNKRILAVVGGLILVGWIFSKNILLRENLAGNSSEKVAVTSFSSNTFINSIGIEFVEIPVGSFEMGCSEGDLDCSSNEKPSHTVTISEAFYIGKYKVTQGQWKAVMRSNRSKFIDCGKDCPVENINWDDIQEFITKLCESENMNPCKYRLPSESEWEYAARGGSSTRYFWGNEEKRFLFFSMLDNYAWFEENSSNKTHPVGQKKPNGYGLYDMLGNLWEWTGDAFEINYFGESLTPYSKSAKYHGNPVIRGCSWISDSKGCRLSSRGSSYSGSRYDYYGFRLVLVP